MFHGVARALDGLMVYNFSRFKIGGLHLGVVTRRTSLARNLQGETFMFMFVFLHASVLRGRSYSVFILYIGKLILPPRK